MSPLYDHAEPLRLPPECEPSLLDRFLKAEAMALWAVRAAQLRDVPANVLAFLKQHEADEEEHLKHFETLVGYQSWGREILPTVPHQWPSLAVLLFGYEALGLEFAKLLVGLRPDMQSIVDDEETHVTFFEHEIRKLLVGEGVDADQARISAKAWWKKLPRTIERYLQDSSLDSCRAEVASAMQAAIQQRFMDAGLLR